MSVQVGHIVEFLRNGDTFTAFELADSLDWRDRGPYENLKNEYIWPPNNFDENKHRNRFIVLLKEVFSDYQHTESSSCHIAKSLLSEDFVPQKRHLHLKKRKHNFVLLQGTHDCGLHYFLQWNHRGNCSFKPIKASQIIGVDNEIDFWDQFVRSLDLPIDVRKTKKSIPSEIALRIEDQLKEKPVIMVVYDIESLLENNCSEYLKKFTDYLACIPLSDDEEYGFYCYFVHRGGVAFAECHEKLIVLPPVSEMDEGDIMNLYYNYEEHFKHCDREVKDLFTGRKKLSEVIDFFIKHSSCGDEISIYFDKNLNF